MPERKVFKDYAESDVREVVERANPSSWQDLIQFLEKRGLEIGRVTPGEDAHLIADARQAMKDNVPFPRNPEQAYRVLKSHRNPELVRQEEQKWGARSESKPASEPRPRQREA